MPSGKTRKNENLTLKSNVSAHKNQVEPAKARSLNDEFEAESRQKCTATLDNCIFYLPDKVLGGDDAGGDGVAERVKLDGLMDLEVALAEEHVEVRVLLNRDVDLARVFGTRASWLLLVVLLLGGFIHLTLRGLSFHTL